MQSNNSTEITLKAIASDDFRKEVSKHWLIAEAVTC